MSCRSAAPRRRPAGRRSRSGMSRRSVRGPPPPARRAQHLGRAGEGRGDLEQTLLAVGKVSVRAPARRRGRNARPPEDLFGHGIGGADATAPVPPCPSRSRSPARASERRQLANSWLIGRSAPSRAHARLGLESGDILTQPHHLPGGRRQHAGQKIDEGGLAGAVGPIIAWRAPRSSWKVTYAGGQKAPPKRLVSAGFEDGAHRRRARAAGVETAHQALPGRPSQDDQEQADPELPVLRRQSRDAVLQHLVDPAPAMPP